jgi:hypothetical protein
MLQHSSLKVQFAPSVRQARYGTVEHREYASPPIKFNGEMAWQASFPLQQLLLVAYPQISPSSRQPADQDRVPHLKSQQERMTQNSSHYPERRSLSVAGIHLEADKCLNPNHCQDKTLSNIEHGRHRPDHWQSKQGRCCQNQGHRRKEYRHRHSLYFQCHLHKDLHYHKYHPHLGLQCKSVKTKEVTGYLLV